MEQAIKMPMKPSKMDFIGPHFDGPNTISKLGETDEKQLIETLCRRIEELETDKNVDSQIYQAFRALETRYHRLIENIPDMVYSLDAMGTIRTMNKASSLISGYSSDEVIGRQFLDFVYPEDREYAIGTYFEAMAARQDISKDIQFRLVTKSGDVRWLQANCATQFTPQGQLIIHEGVARDITEIIDRQHDLIKVQEQLEAQVRTRTKELMQINAELHVQINERLAVEKVLLEREKALEMEKANLKEANTALKVLLKRREMDKQDLEEQVLHNVKKMVIPYLGKMQKEVSSEKLKLYLSIVESNLIDITCGFSRRLSFEFYGLSTSELKVANFIRQGKKTREIADVLGISFRTVEAFRQSIRNKLRLQNKKVNLRTFLMSIN